MLQFMEEKKQGAQQFCMMPSLCKSKLTGYADSFRELARSFQKEENPDVCDRRQLFEEEKLRENCNVIAGHLMELADIMEETAGEVTGIRQMEERTRKKLSGALLKEKILLEEACILPCRDRGSRVALSLSTAGQSMVSADMAADILSDVLNRKYCLSLSGAECIDSRCRTFLFLEKPEYVAFTGFARVVKGSEEISGDNYSILQSEQGNLTMLLSDGTGSGEDACQGSSWVLDLAEKLLESGYCPEAALRLINSAAIAGESTTGHPTLDLCRVDLYSGNCDFAKAGGAVSYRKRGNEVEQISGGRLPLGIFQDLEPYRQFVQLREGDSILMMTDGVLEAFREKGYEEAVRSCLAEMEEKNPRELAEKLMQLAIFGSEGNIRDDMTILAATIWKNP